MDTNSCSTSRHWDKTESRTTTFFSCQSHSYYSKGSCHEDPRGVIEHSHLEIVTLAWHRFPIDIFNLTSSINRFYTRLTLSKKQIVYYFIKCPLYTKPFSDIDSGFFYSSKNYIFLRNRRVDWFGFCILEFLKLTFHKVIQLIIWIPLAGLLWNFGIATKSVS